MALTARHIITVTSGGILYRNSDDIISWIDFKNCNENWLATLKEPSQTEDDYCVGIHDTEQATWLDVEFYSEPHTRFEFRSYAQRDTLLFHPMQTLGGWITREAR
jgi:hypothetical protein